MLRFMVVVPPGLCGCNGSSPEAEPEEGSAGKGEVGRPDHSVLRHLVPLAISDEQLEEGLDVMAQATKAARGGA